MKISSDYDNKVDFSNYSSYNIVEIDAAETGINELDLQRIKNAVKNELNGKELMEKSEADIEVHLHVLVEDKVNVDYDTNYYSSGFYGEGMALEWQQPLRLMYMNIKKDLWL